MLRDGTDSCDLVVIALGFRWSQASQAMRADGIMLDSSDCSSSSAWRWITSTVLSVKS